MTPETDTIIALFDRRGADAYLAEAVTQEAHALQSAARAEAAGAGEALIVAALLHDLGHLIHRADEDLAGRGIDGELDLHVAKRNAVRIRIGWRRPIDRRGRFNRRSEPGNWRGEDQRKSETGQPEHTCYLKQSESAQYRR